jgi:hypothetical protein
MDACHVLLERSWMFDKKVFHDVRENSYDFFKDDQRYKLVPMSEKNMESNNNKGMDNNNKKVMNGSNNKNMHGRNNQIMLCSAKEFLREHKYSGCCLAIMPKRIRET